MYLVCITLVSFSASPREGTDGTDEKVRPAAAGVARVREVGCSFLHEAPKVHCPRRKKGQTGTGGCQLVVRGARLAVTYSLVRQRWGCLVKGRQAPVRLEPSLVFVVDASTPLHPLGPLDYDTMLRSNPGPVAPQSVAVPRPVKSRRDPVLSSLNGRHGQTSQRRGPDIKGKGKARLEAAREFPVELLSDKGPFVDS